MRQIVVINGARTPFGGFCGALQDITATDLGAIAARGAIDRSGVKPEAIDQVIIGNVLHTSSDAIYCARHIGLKSGVPFGAPALSVNRMGGSGLQALISGAQSIELGQAEMCLVGGTENMSLSPQIIRKTRSQSLAGYSFMEDSLWTSLIDSYNNMMMIDTAENIAKKYNIPRQMQDEFAYRSYSFAVLARDRGRLGEEIVPVYLNKDKKNAEIILNDGNIRETTPEKLMLLRPASRKDGVVTAGNSSGISDGAAALIIASREKAMEIGLRVKARLKSYACCGVDPDIMGIGAVPALKTAADRAGLSIPDIDLFEINELFAAQYLACEFELGLDRKKVNVNGGAIAIGNPLAATGARLVLTLIYEMAHRNATFGAVALSVGGGQGIAAIFEKI